MAILIAILITSDHKGRYAVTELYADGSKWECCRTFKSLRGAKAQAARANHTFKPVPVFVL